MLGGVDQPPYRHCGTGAPPPAPWPAAYRAFFDCFNAGRYFEAHEVLEALWLPVRGRNEACFYQGLIQLAGAFVHLQRGRPAPAVALLRRCQQHLRAYPDQFLGVDVAQLRRQIAGWLAQARAGEVAALVAGGPWLEPPDAAAG